MKKRIIISLFGIAALVIAAIAFQTSGPRAEETVAPQQQVQADFSENDALLNEEHPAREEFLKENDAEITASYYAKWCPENPDASDAECKKYR